MDARKLLDRAKYFQGVLNRGGGLITCGDHLGVMVAPVQGVKGCPRGWCFVPLEGATLAAVNLAYEHMTAKNGRRSKWPANQKKKASNEDERLEQVFASQDYIE